MDGYGGKLSRRTFVATGSAIALGWFAISRTADFGHAADSDASTP